MYRRSARIASVRTASIRARKLHRACKRSQTPLQPIQRVQKPYDHHDCPEKIELNHWYANDVMKFLGPCPQMILDSEHRITSKILIKRGFEPSSIHAPNINASHCAALRRLGVKSPHMTIEQYSKQCHVRAAWADTQTTVGGCASRGHYPGVFADNFLLKNRSRIGTTCLLAISIATRNAVTETIHRTNAYTLKEQISRLAVLRGFRILEFYSSDYKKNMHFARWKLVYEPKYRANPKPLLLWHGAEDHYVGFPPGYTSI